MLQSARCSSMTTVIMTEGSAGAEDPRLTDGRPAVVGTGAMATRGAGCVQSLMSAVEHLAEPARTDNRRLCASGPVLAHAMSMMPQPPPPHLAAPAARRRVKGAR